MEGILDNLGSFGLRPLLFGIKVAKNAEILLGICESMDFPSVHKIGLGRGIESLTGMHVPQLIRFFLIYIKATGKIELRGNREGGHRENKHISE